MFNVNSPIVNNMLYGNQQQHGCLSNMVNIGQGYNMNVDPYNNMGYYNGNNYGYYNPYAVQRQQEIIKNKQLEIQRKRTESDKSLARYAYGLLGKTVSEEYLENKYDPQPNTPNLTTRELYKNQIIDRLNILNSVQYQQFLQQQEANKIEAQNRFVEQSLKRTEGKSFLECFDVINQDIVESYNRKLILQGKRNIVNYYNPLEYGQLIDATSQFNPNNMYMNNLNIDDMEVQLPPHLMTSYEKKKKAFLDKINMR